jgi:hypothetical protein
VIDNDFYERKAEQYKSMRDSIKQKLNAIDSADDQFYLTIDNMLRLSQKAPSLLLRSEMEYSRRLVNFVLQNLTLNQNLLRWEYKKPFDILARTAKNANWQGLQDEYRTLIGLDDNQSVAKIKQQNSNIMKYAKFGPSVITTLRFNTEPPVLEELDMRVFGKIVNDSGADEIRTLEGTANGAMSSYKSGAETVLGHKFAYPNDTEQSTAEVTYKAERVARAIQVAVESCTEFSGDVRIVNNEIEVRARHSHLKELPDSWPSELTRWPVVEK